MNRKQITELYPDTIIWDGFDNAIVGVTNDMRVAYNIDKMVDIMMNEWKTDKESADKPADFPEDLTEEDAFEYLEFNVFTAYVGEFTPIHIWM